MIDNGANGVLSIDSTFVPAEQRGNSAAARLCDAAFAFARVEELPVLPRCSYVRDRYIPKHAATVAAGALVEVQMDTAGLFIEMSAAGVATIRLTDQRRRNPLTADILVRPCAHHYCLPILACCTPSTPSRPLVVGCTPSRWLYSLAFTASCTTLLLVSAQCIPSTPSLPHTLTLAVHTVTSGAVGLLAHLTVQASLQQFLERCATMQPEADALVRCLVLESTGTIWSSGKYPRAAICGPRALQCCSLWFESALALQSVE